MIFQKSTSLVQTLWLLVMLKLILEDNLLCINVLLVCGTELRWSNYCVILSKNLQRMPKANESSSMIL